MASKIEQGLAKVQGGGVAKLSSVKGRQYTSASIQVDQNRINRGGAGKQLAASLENFVQASVKAGHYYVDVQEKKAKQNVKKIMSSMSPEVIASARADGTILASDDPYTIAALNRALAAQESDAVYTRLSRELNQGIFTSRAELDEAKMKYLNEANESAMKTYGVDSLDEDWIAGWDSDVEAKNIAIYQQFDSVQDQMTQNMAMMTSKTGINQVIADGSLSTQDFTSIMTTKLTDAHTTGMIRNGKQLRDVIAHTLSGVTSQANAPERLEALGNIKINLDGQEVSIKDAMGVDSWELHIAKAEQSKFNKDFEARKELSDTIATALRNPDPDVALADLTDRLKVMDSQQPSGQVTPERMELVNAINKVRNDMVVKAAKIRAETLKAQQQETRIRERKKVLAAAREGSVVSFDIKDMPENEATGKYSRNDDVLIYNEEMAQLANDPNLSEDQKIERKLFYALKSAPDSPWRSALKSTVDAAQRQIEVAGQTDDPNVDLSEVNRLRDIWSKNKSAMAQLHPEISETYAMMELLGDQGINPKRLFQAAAIRKDIREDPLRAKEQEKNWTTATNSNKELQYLPERIRKAARVMFDANTYLGGSSDAGASIVKNYLLDNYEPFGDVKTGYGGRIAKSTLMVNNDPASADRSSAAMRQSVTDALGKLPYDVPESTLTWAELDNGTVLVSDPTGTVSVEFDKDYFLAIDKQYQASLAVKPADTEKGINQLKKDQKRAKGSAKGAFDTVPADDPRSAKNKKSIWNR